MDTQAFEYAEFILVVTTIQFRGPNANRANCERVVNSMLRMWNRGFTYEGKPVIFTVTWEVGGKEKPYYDQVWMVPGKLPEKRSYMQGEPVVPSPLFGVCSPFYPPLRPNQQHTCYLYSGDPDYDWMVAHEFGHLLGLEDRYDQATGEPKSGWEGNIMAVRQMPVEQRNIDEFCRLVKKWKAWHVMER